MNRQEEMRQQVIDFHKEHPEVWTLFVKFTFDRINRGCKNYSVNGIFERIRWETNAGGDGEAHFKIGNNHRPFFARAFMRKYPEHNGFFRTREQTSKDSPANGREPMTPADTKPTHLHLYLVEKHGTG